MARKQGQLSRKTILSSTGVLVLVVLLVLVNVIFSNADFRWDTTEDKIYSLSEGTKNILANLSHPVNIKFYFSRSNPELPVEFKLFAKRVWEFLLEYELAAAGNLVLQRYDPKPDSDEEEWARKFGLSAMRTESGENVFFGLVFLQADLEERIEWLEPAQEETLEYDLSQILYQLQYPKKKVIGVISYLPVFGQATGAGMAEFGASPAVGQAWSFIAELNKIYEVRKVPGSTDKIDPEIDLLLVIHPKDLHPDLRFAIDQYVLAGGNILFFVDPSCISDTGTKHRQYFAGTNRSTRDLFTAWGISVNFDKVLGDLDMASRRSTRGTLEGNPFHINARGEAFNPTNLLTSNLESMLFPKTGAIAKLENSSFEFEPLIQSGTNAALVIVSQAEGDPAAFRTRLNPTGERFNIAVRIRGRFNTAFPEGPPPAGPAGSATVEQPHAAPLTVAKKTSTLIVVADADLLADQYYIRHTGYWGYQTPKVINDNLNFLVNACEILTGSDDLIGLRTRGKLDRPFTRVMEIERKAKAQWRAKEKELVEGFEAGKQKLMALESQKSPTQQSFGFSPRQQAEVEKLKTEQQRINRELKEVRKSLRADVETLGAVLKSVNIFMMPLFVTLAGIGYGVYRQRKMKRK